MSRSGRIFSFWLHRCSSKTVSRRKRYDPQQLLYLMQDSSPLCNYDWLMTRGKEISRRVIIDVAKSFLELIRLIKIFVAEHTDVDGNIEESLGMEPEDAWRPHLQKLTNLNEHTYTPANLSAGCRNVAHENSATSWQIHLDIPSGIPLDSRLANVMSMTSDMGSEMGGPQFRVHKAF